MADHSLQDQIQGSWKQLSGSVRQEWGRLTHNDVEQIQGSAEILAGKIQQHYGVTEAEAHKQMKQWADKYQTYKAEQADKDTSTN